MEKLFIIELDDGQEVEAVVKSFEPEYLKKVQAFLMKDYPGRTIKGRWTEGPEMEDTPSAAPKKFQWQVPTAEGLQTVGTDTYQQKKELAQAYGAEPTLTAYPPSFNIVQRMKTEKGAKKYRYDLQINGKPQTFLSPLKIDEQLVARNIAQRENLKPNQVMVSQRLNPSMKFRGEQLSEAYGVPAGVGETYASIFPHLAEQYAETPASESPGNIDFLRYGEDVLSMPGRTIGAYTDLISEGSEADFSESLGARSQDKTGIMQKVLRDPVTGLLMGLGGPLAGMTKGLPLAARGLTMGGAEGLAAVGLTGMSRASRDQEYTPGEAGLTLGLSALTGGGSQLVAEPFRRVAVARLAKQYGVSPQVASEMVESGVAGLTPASTSRRAAASAARQSEKLAEGLTPGQFPAHLTTTAPSTPGAQKYFRSPFTGEFSPQAPQFPPGLPVQKPIEQMVGVSVPKGGIFWRSATDAAQNQLSQLRSANTISKKQFEKLSKNLEELVDDLGDLAKRQDLPESTVLANDYLTNIKRFADNPENAQVMELLTGPLKAGPAAAQKIFNIGQMQKVAAQGLSPYELLTLNPQQMLGLLKGPQSTGALTGAAQMLPSSRVPLTRAYLEGTP